MRCDRSFFEKDWDTDYGCPHGILWADVVIWRPHRGVPYAHRTEVIGKMKG